MRRLKRYDSHGEDKLRDRIGGKLIFGVPTLVARQNIELRDYTFQSSKVGSADDWNETPFFYPAKCGIEILVRM